MDMCEHIQEVIANDDPDVLHEAYCFLKETPNLSLYQLSNFKKSLFIDHVCIATAIDPRYSNEIIEEWYEREQEFVDTFIRLWELEMI